MATPALVLPSSMDDEPAIRARLPRANADLFSWPVSRGLSDATYAMPYAGCVKRPLSRRECVSFLVALSP